MLHLARPDVRDIAICNSWRPNLVKLVDMILKDEGLLVIGIVRGSKYIGVPRCRYEVKGGDRLIIYGRAKQIETLSKRGQEIPPDNAHDASIKAHTQELRKQDKAVREDE